MTELTASRTLVKSPPELWAECSDAGALSRHLEGFGDIRITRLEPETVVAWEGEAANGTIRLEPSGWGTKVVLTAEATAADPPVPVSEEPARVPEESVAAADEPAMKTPTPRGPLARLFGLLRRRPAPEPEPAALQDPPAATERVEDRPPPVGLELMALEQALDSLGQAHHRPFSRA
jgi:hypothetical protein